MIQRPEIDPADAKGHVRRVAALGLWIVSALVYFGYRTTTLNADAFVYSLIFYVAELLIAINLAFFVFSTWRFPKREPGPPQKGTIDVFIPTYNEPPDLVRKTVEAALAIKTPHQTWILDDGRRPAFEAMATELGCKYIARADNEHAKAGNLNNALKHSTAEFIAVLDADHAPLPSFLDRVMGYFRDERVAFVQTPQAFDNLDSFLHLNVGDGTDSWNEQTLWFHAIECGRDYWNATAYCGSPAVIRRKALDDIGGIASDTVTEDTHTSIRLHKRGWRAVYHSEVLATGLAPSSPASFFTQRLRWGRGQMHLWRIEPILSAKTLTWPQRLSYFASVLHYFTGVQSVILFLAPAIGLLLGTVPLIADARVFFPLFFVNLAAGALVFTLFARGHGRWLAGEHFNAALIAPYLLSLSGLFFAERRFIVTPKTSPDRFAIWPVALPFFISTVHAIAFAGGAARLASGFEVGDSLGTTIALMVWSIWIGVFAGSVVTKSWGQFATERESGDATNGLIDLRPYTDR